VRLCSYFENTARALAKESRLPSRHKASNPMCEGVNNKRGPARSSPTVFVKIGLFQKFWKMYQI
jgi:hypothetical protein